MAGSEERKAKKNVEVYKRKMEGISFMKDDLNDVPEIFDKTSEKCIQFLIKSFIALDPGFYYLSLKSLDAVNDDLVKAACILQIYPFSNAVKKRNGFFDGMKEDEIHYFWMKFFLVCELYHSDPELSFHNSGFIKPKFNSVFQDIDKTLEFLNYKIQIHNPEILQGINFEEEFCKRFSCDESKIIRNSEPLGDPLKKCNQFGCDSSNIVGSCKLSNNAPNIELEEEEKKKKNDHFDCSELANNIKILTKKLSHKRDARKPDLSTNPHKDFFVDFSQAVKEITTYKNNLDMIDSFDLQDVWNNISSGSGTLRFPSNSHIQRCNDLIQCIKSEQKSIQ